MNVKIQKVNLTEVDRKLRTYNSEIRITGSKSETNRLLLLQALFPEIVLENTSNSDDSHIMIKSLKKNQTNIDVHHAGTAMRFLTAYYAIQEGKEVVLTGSSRMKERPIKILVDALKQLGADIEYVENYGYPPLSIWGKKPTQNKVSLLANVSSQYISALLLIAPKLENGLELTLEGQITSVPYIKMTLALLNEIGVETSFIGKVISVNPKSSIVNCQLSIESDWSSASYFYSIVALSEIGTQLTLSSFKKNSLQGDSVLADIYIDFGVETTFEENNIILRKSKIKDQKSLPDSFTRTSEAIYNLQSSPDLAQTIVVTCFGLGIAACFTGLHTLKIKETDRLEALQIELTKLGAKVKISNDSLAIEASSSNFFIARNEVVSIKTYQDHRMAMAFAPLALKTPIIIENAQVVSKSYPAFWEDLKSIGFKIEKI